MRQLAKYVPLSMACEWQQCTDMLSNMDDFIKHTQSHLQELLREEGTKDGQLCEIGRISCAWRACGHDMERNFPELVRHVYFHVFHAKIKNLGAHLMSKHKQQCLLDAASRNMVPELPDRLQCCWTNCQQFFDNPERFFVHVNSHADVYNDGNNIAEGASCDWEECGLVFRSKYKLRDHLRSHTQEKVVACPNCGSLFSSNTKFIDHLERQRQVHLQSYQCSHCRKKFPSERLLRDHMRHHVNHYKCPMCDMTCPCPSTLRRHMLHRHTKEKPYACSQCDSKFTVVSDLRKHEEVHSTVSYACNVEDCSYRCHNYQTLANHFKKEHQGVNMSRFACHICEKRFTRGTKLTFHLKNKHTFKWPSGHRRFRYKEMEDGLFRLQTIRYESIELTEQILTDKLHKQDTEGTGVQSTVASEKAADWAYNLKMLGEVALKVDKVQGRRRQEQADRVEDDGAADDGAAAQMHSGNEPMDIAEVDSLPLSPASGSPQVCCSSHHDNTSSLNSSRSLSPILAGCACFPASKENQEPAVQYVDCVDWQGNRQQLDMPCPDDSNITIIAPTSDYETYTPTVHDIQVTIMDGTETLATVSGKPCSVIIDPTTGNVEYPV